MYSLDTSTRFYTTPTIAITISAAAMPLNTTTTINIITTTTTAINILMHTYIRTGSAEAASRGRDLLESQLQELRRLREESTDYTHGLEEEVTNFTFQL